MCLKVWTVEIRLEEIVVVDAVYQSYTVEQSWPLDQNLQSIVTVNYNAQSLRSHVSNGRTRLDLYPDRRPTSTFIQSLSFGVKYLEP